MNTQELTIAIRQLALSALRSVRASKRRDVALLALLALRRTMWQDEAKERTNVR